MPNQKDKIPWPGEFQVVKAGAYMAGLSSDSSGVEAIDAWATTATPEELDWLLGPVGPDGQRQEKKGYAYNLGLVIGLGSYPLWSRFWRWLFRG